MATDNESIVSFAYLRRIKKRRFDRRRSINLRWAGGGGAKTEQTGMSRPRMAAVAIEISETKELFGQLTTLQPAPAGPQRIRTGRKRTESTYGRDAGSKPLHSRDGPSLESPTWLATSQRRCERSKKKSRINVTARPWKVRIDRYPSCRLRECKCTSRPSHSFFFVFSGHTMTIDLILPAAPIAPINHNKLILIIGCL